LSRFLFLVLLAFASRLDTISIPPPARQIALTITDTAYLLHMCDFGRQRGKVFFIPRHGVTGLEGLKRFRVSAPVRAVFFMLFNNRLYAGPRLRLLPSPNDSPRPGLSRVMRRSSFRTSRRTSF